MPSPFLAMREQNNINSRFPCNLKQHFFSGCALALAHLSDSIEIEFGYCFQHAEARGSWRRVECMFYALLPDFMWLEAEASTSSKLEQKKHRWIDLLLLKTSHGERGKKMLSEIPLLKHKMKRKTSPVYKMCMCSTLYDFGECLTTKQNTKPSQKKRPKWKSQRLSLDCTFTKLIFPPTPSSPHPAQEINFSLKDYSI